MIPLLISSAETLVLPVFHCVPGQSFMGKMNVSAKFTDLRKDRIADSHPFVTVSDYDSMRVERAIKRVCFGKRV